MENGFAESFHSRLRDEFLATEVFESLAAARKLTAAWRDDYNHYRPHSSLGYVAPADRGPLHRFRSDVGFGYASANIYATAVQRSYPNRYLHSDWYRNLMLVTLTSKAQNSFKMRVIAHMGIDGLKMP